VRATRGDLQDVHVLVHLVRNLRYLVSNDRTAVNAAFRTSLRFVDRRLFTFAVLATLLITAGASDRALASDTCVGDCPPLDQRVTVPELIIGVNIALGAVSADRCPSYDVDGSGHVKVSALITAVSNLLDGCPGGPTPPRTLPATQPATQPATPTSTALAPTVTPKTSNPSATPTATASATPTATAVPGVGPVVRFFGVVFSDTEIVTPTPGAVPIYSVLNGSGFFLVIEALPGADQTAVGLTTEASDGPPDLQIQVTRPLGDGSPAVCDDVGPSFGGVPAIDPPVLDDPDTIADQLNDFGCRFYDGGASRATVGHTCDVSCIRPGNFDNRCESDQRAIQYCAIIDMPLRFPQGDTLVTVQVRDKSGKLGPPAQLILHSDNP
jgi:hypothetical protein